MDEKLLPLPANCEVSSVCINGKIHAVMYSKVSGVYQYTYRSEM